MARLRSPPTITLKALHGNVLYSNDILNFPVCEEDATLSLEVCYLKSEERYEKEVSEGALRLDHLSSFFDSVNDYTNSIFFQFTVLYTSHEGERKIRVMNLKMDVENEGKKIYESVNSEAYMATITKRAAAQYEAISPENSINYIQNNAKHYAGNMKKLGLENDFIESLISDYTLGLLKGNIFKINPENNEFSKFFFK